MLPTKNNCHPGEVTSHFTFLIIDKKCHSSNSSCYEGDVHALLEHIGYGHRKSCKKSSVNYNKDAMASAQPRKI